ncbi:DgyrCDS9433 [Dimorphilus gyrociliatus]|nr:DgyrCDS9433 [Dimorphilus gyrociliatus]
MSTKSYLKLKEKGANVELLPVGAVHEHRLNSDELPIYYSDLIIHKSTAKKYKQLEDLKGCKYAYNTQDSVSGYILPLLELKKKGYNSSFFSNMLESGSHLNSIKMVREQRVECASVDSNALKFYLKSYPHAHDDFIAISSLGPLPVQPIVVRSSLPTEIKEELADALLSLPTLPNYSKLFAEYGIRKFTKVDDEDYQAEMDIYKSIGQQSKTPAYY